VKVARDGRAVQFAGAPANGISRLNHTGAASGVAYAEPRGATNPLNWPEVGLKAWSEPLE